MKNLRHYLFSCILPFSIRLVLYKVSFVYVISQEAGSIPTPRQGSYHSACFDKPHVMRPKFKQCLRCTENVNCPVFYNWSHLALIVSNDGGKHLILTNQSVFLVSFSFKQPIRVTGQSFGILSRAFPAPFKVLSVTGRAACAPGLVVSHWGVSQPWHLSWACALV